MFESKDVLIPNAFVQCLHNENQTFTEKAWNDREGKRLEIYLQKKHVVFRKFTHTNLRHVRVINTAILHHSATTLSHDGTFFPVYGA